MSHAAGPFDVEMQPDPNYETAEGGVVLGRVAFKKQFHGALDATSVVQMLSAGSPVKGSAGYVAIERVVGTLDGRAGAFILQHNATMNRGQPSLAIVVVPDTGTGGLVGLAGTMAIDIVEGKHSYRFEYTLPDA
jgi:hypothetical protein